MSYQSSFKFIVSLTLSLIIELKVNRKMSIRFINQSNYVLRPILYDEGLSQ